MQRDANVTYAVQDGFLSLSSSHDEVKMTVASAPYEEITVALGPDEKRMLKKFAYDVLAAAEALED